MIADNDDDVDVEDGDEDNDAYEDGLSVSVCQCYSVDNGSKTSLEVYYCQQHVCSEQLTTG